MRAHLLATPVVVALLAPMPAQAQDATWLFTPSTALYSDPNNWTPATVPTGTGTAFFGPTTVPALTVTGGTTVVGGWTFNAGAPAYTFAVGPGALAFNGAGIVINAGSATIINQNVGVVTFNGTSTAGSATINNTGSAVNFIGTSTAGNASINNQGNLVFLNDATAGNATITNSFFVGFEGQSTAGNATVHTIRGAVQFLQNASGGLARFTDADGTFSISTAGPFGAAGPVTVGSIEGSGLYFLDANQLTTGGNNLSTTVSGLIQGPGGSLVKTGSGTLTLSNINSYSGPTTVNAGALIVDGSIASSSLTTVSSGATLGGSGTVGSTIINAGGSFAPGPAGAPGAMTVAGTLASANLAFQSGALYVVQVNPTNASTTNVSGTASLAGTVHANFAPGSYFRNSFTILTARDGRTGTFDALATSGLPAGFRASLSYTGNTAVLNLLAQFVPTAGQPSVPGQPPPPTFTVNHIKVGNAIETFFNNGGTLPAFVPLFGLTGGNLTGALDQLHGEAASGAQKVGFQLGDQFLNLMLDPFVDGRSGVGGADHPALGFAPERETMPPEIARAYASVFKAPSKLVPTYEPRWTVWGGAYGGSNRTSGDLAVIGSHDLSARTAGFAGGFWPRVWWRRHRLEPVAGVGRRQERCLPGRRLRRNALGSGLSCHRVRLRQPLDVHRPLCLCRQSPNRRLQRAELRRAARRRLPLRDHLRRNYTLRRDPSAEFPHARFQRGRCQQRRLRPRLQRTNRDRYPERAGRALRSGAGGLFQRGAGATRTARLGARLGERRHADPGVPVASRRELHR
jgi:autotransporter-associated beta strand protein